MRKIWNSYLFINYIQKCNQKIWKLLVNPKNKWEEEKSDSNTFY